MRRIQENNENTIEIQEEVRIPGTDYILEKGDRIQVNEATRMHNFLLPEQTPGEPGVYPHGSEIVDSMAVSKDVVIRKSRRANLYSIFVRNIVDQYTTEVYLHDSEIRRMNDFIR